MTLVISDKLTLPIWVKLERSVSEYFVSVGEQMGKTVLPLPTAVLLENPEMIVEKIRNVLISQGVLKDHSSIAPEEAYLLGMAYQSGYLVEQSPELAEKYLLMAASGSFDSQIKGYSTVAT